MSTEARTGYGRPGAQTWEENYQDGMVRNRRKAEGRREEGRPHSFTRGLCPSPSWSSLTRTFCLLHFNIYFLSQPAAGTQGLEPAAAGGTPGTAAQRPPARPAASGYIHGGAAGRGGAAGWPRPPSLERRTAVLGSSWSAWRVVSQTT